MSKYLQLSVLAAVASFSVSPAMAATETFDDPVTLGSAQAPDTWYTDRYAPAGFTAPVFFDGDNRLLHHIDAADGASSRPGGYSGVFYDTQGRKYDLPTGTTSASIDLYVPADWADTGRRMAGFWGTGVDAGGAVTAYPIISFSSVGSTSTFSVWDGAGYVDLGLPTGFAYDGWTTLAFSLNGSSIDYTIGDLSFSFDANGTVALSNIILQGHNTTAGVSYDIYWDNLSAPAAAAVPEPATWAMLIAGFAAVGYSMRRRPAKVAFA